MSSDYHNDYAAVSKTALNVFYDSPQEYFLKFVTRSMEHKPPSKFMLEGTVAHAVLLERKAFDDVVTVYSDACYRSDGGLNGKVAAQFRDDHPGAICLKADDVDRLKALVASLYGSQLMAAIDASLNMEHRHDAEVHGLPCRCKPDIVGDLGGLVAVYDLKFCAAVDHATFNRTAKRLRYWLQDAHYSAICEQVYAKPVRFRFFAVEATYPFRVQAYWYPDRCREIARGSHQNKLAELRECRLTGIWEDRWPNELTLAPWDVDELDQLVEFGEAASDDEFMELT